MKKLFIVLTVLLLSFSLTACKGNNVEQVEVPDFIGLSYGDAVRLAFSLDLAINPSSDYNDDVEKNSVYYQSIEVGTKVDVDTTIDITYSTGFSPEGVIVLPDFNGMTDEEIQQWIYDEDITKYTIKNTFDPSVALGEFVSIEIDQVDETNTDYLRKDEYNFLVSRGPLEIEEVEFNMDAVRGVNLGGWFVLEGWMTAELFSGIDGSDETAFMQQHPDAENAIEEHWDTFITEDDFIWLAENDVEYVRIPIPWWLFGDTYYEGTEHEVTYANSVFYIDRAMTWAEDHNIKVLLDLHTAPGCQNGFDNGGVAGLLEWDTDENRELTLLKTRDIIQHFAQYDSLWGYEVLNEPASWGIYMPNLREFYEDAYNVIRVYAPDIWIGFHDAFTGGWGDFFDEHDTWTNVFLDTHLYQVFGDGWGDMDIVEHVDFVHTTQYNNVHQYGSSVPVIVGEWSLGLPGSVYDGLDGQGVSDVKAAFMNAQLNVYESGMGWFFWNYKIDNGEWYKEWSYVEMVNQGYFPTSYSQE